MGGVPAHADAEGGKEEAKAEALGKVGGEDASDLQGTIARLETEIKRDLKEYLRLLEKHKVTAAAAAAGQSPLASACVPAGGKGGAEPVDGAPISAAQVVRTVSASLVREGETVDQAFSRIDTDQSGCISGEKMEAALKETGLSSERVQEIFLALDKDKNNRIDRQEFHHAMNSEMLTSFGMDPQELFKMFQALVDAGAVENDATDGGDVRVKFTMQEGAQRGENDKTISKLLNKVRSSHPSTCLCAHLFVIRLPSLLTPPPPTHTHTVRRLPSALWHQQRYLQDQGLSHSRGVRAGCYKGSESAENQGLAAAEGHG
jgi:hypothetical protein